MRNQKMRMVLLSVMLFLFLGINQSIFGQKAEVIKRLQELGMSEQLLSGNIIGENTLYSYDAKFSTTSNNKTDVELASFDPTQPKGSQWVLISKNGKSPSKGDIKKFNKAHNAEQEDINTEPDDSSWKIISDDEHFLIVGMRFNASGLPQKYAFLADCDAELYFDKGAKRLYKAHFYNSKPLKIKIFNVVKLDMTIEYMQIAEKDASVVKDETIVMDVKILGNIVEIIETSEFSNYKEKK